MSTCVFCNFCHVQYHNDGDTTVIIIVISQVLLRNCSFSLNRSVFCTVLPICQGCKKLNIFLWWFLFSYIESDILLNTLSFYNVLSTLMEACPTLDDLYYECTFIKQWMYFYQAMCFLPWRNMCTIKDGQYMPYYACISINLCPKATFITCVFDPIKLMHESCVICYTGNKYKTQI